VPGKLEFMDGACTNAVEDYLHLGLPREAGAVLLVDTDGDEDGVETQDGVETEDGVGSEDAVDTDDGTGATEATAAGEEETK